MDLIISKIECDNVAYLEMEMEKADFINERALTQNVDFNRIFYRFRQREGMVIPLVNY